MLGGVRVAAAELHQGAALHQLADTDQTPVDVEAHDVAHQIVAGVAARDRESCENEAADPAQFAGQLLADLLLEDIERRAPVELDDDVGLAVGDLVARPDRHAALAERGGDGDGLGEEDAGDPAFGDPARDLGGTARDDERPPTRNPFSSSRGRR